MLETQQQADQLLKESPVQREGELAEQLRSQLSEIEKLLREGVKREALLSRQLLELQDQTAADRCVFAELREALAALRHELKDIRSRRKWRTAWLAGLRSSARLLATRAPRLIPPAAFEPTGQSSQQAPAKFRTVAGVKLNKGGAAPGSPDFLKFMRSGGVRVTYFVHRHIARGNLARNNADWAVAAEAYRGALRRDATLTHIWVQLGHVLKERGAWAEAVQAYRRAVELDPHCSEAQAHIVQLIVLTGGSLAAGEEALKRSSPRATSIYLQLRIAAALREGKAT